MVLRQLERRFEFYETRGTVEIWRTCIVLNICGTLTPRPIGNLTPGNMLISLSRVCEKRGEDQEGRELNRPKRIKKPKPEKKTSRGKNSRSRDVEKRRQPRNNTREGLCSP